MIIKNVKLKIDDSRFNNLRLTIQDSTIQPSIASHHSLSFSLAATSSQCHLPPQRCFHSALNFSLSSGVMFCHLSRHLFFHAPPRCQPLPLPKPPNNILLNISMPNAW